ncbi:hypothetical protein Tco_0362765 [Tanacetum coccineum]
MQGVGVIRVRIDMGDKEVTKQDLVAKVVMEVLGRLLGDMVVMPWRCLRSWVKEFHQDRASLVKVPVANFTLQSSVQLLRENTDSVRSNQQISPKAPSEPLKLIGWQLMNSFCAPRAVGNTTSTRLLMAVPESWLGAAYSIDVPFGRHSINIRQHGIRMILQVIVQIFIHSVDLTSDEDPTDEDGDIRIGDSTGVSVSLGGGISLGGKKSRESNISGSDNTGDGGTPIGGGIVTYGRLMASYACDNHHIDTPYPLSASLMKKMLKHKLEVEIDGIGNDMTYAVQLIKFIKNQLASSVPSA